MAKLVKLVPKEAYCDQGGVINVLMEDGRSFRMILKDQSLDVGCVTPMWDFTGTVIATFSAWKTLNYPDGTDPNMGQGTAE